MKTKRTYVIYVIALVLAACNVSRDTITFHYKMETVSGPVYLEGISSFQYLDPPACSQGEEAEFDPIVWYTNGIRNAKPYNGLFFKPTMTGKCFYSAEGWAVDIVK